MGDEYEISSFLYSFGSLGIISGLTPLHNPANIVGIKAFKKVLPNVPSIGIFDTSFHQTMPESSFLYPLPREYYEKYGIRKYGFYGMSHKYVTERSAVRVANLGTIANGTVMQ